MSQAVRLNATMDEDLLRDDLRMKAVAELPAPSQRYQDPRPPIADSTGWRM